MPGRSCRSCGAAFTPASRWQWLCPDCGGHGGPPTHTGWSPYRDPKAQRLFRAKLMKRAGGRCEAWDTSIGRRCTATTDLRACHIKALADGGSYEEENGQLLCGRHDRETDS